MTFTTLTRRGAARRSSPAVVTVIAIFSFLLLGIPSALAQPKPGHDGGPAVIATSSGDHDGDADADPNTAYTEDNALNDRTPNNVVDAGDNLHPSGKDRSVEHGNSGNQGKSESDPDGPVNGGVDKPNGKGGLDLADQDGNNGCGNDDDFEDDNNGNCGGKPKPQVVPPIKPPPGCGKVCPPCCPPQSPPVVNPTIIPTTVPPTTPTTPTTMRPPVPPPVNPPGVQPGGPTTPTTDTVLGENLPNPNNPQPQVQQPQQPNQPLGAQLPVTGRDVPWEFVLLGAGLLLMGSGSVLLSPRKM